MQGQTIKSVWNGTSSEELAILTPQKTMSASLDSAAVAERLPSKYALRWVVIGFCTTFWAGVAAVAFMVF